MISVSGKATVYYDITKHISYLKDMIYEKKGRV